MPAPKGGNSGSFKKGNKSGGRPPLPAHIKEIIRGTKPQIIEAYWKIANMPLDKIKDYKPQNLLEAGTLKCLMEFAKTGKTDYIYRLWAECHGRPKESIDFDVYLKAENQTSIDITRLQHIQGEETIAEVTRILVESGAFEQSVFDSDNDTQVN